MLETQRHVLKDQNVKGLSLVTALEEQWAEKSSGLNRRHLYCLESFSMKRFYKTKYFSDNILLFIPVLSSIYSVSQCIKQTLLYLYKQSQCYFLCKNDSNLLEVDSCCASRAADICLYDLRLIWPLKQHSFLLQNWRWLRMWFVGSFPVHVTVHARLTLCCWATGGGEQRLLSW